jgi:hypothetical protein
MVVEPTKSRTLMALITQKVAATAKRQSFWFYYWSAVTASSQRFPRIQRPAVLLGSDHVPS